jgi:plastocyanin
MLKRPLRDRRLRLLIVLTVVLAAFCTVALAATRSVSVKDNFFAPRTLTINKGSKLTWKWASYGIPHNVTVKSGPVRFHSRTMGGGTYSHTFLRRGTYRLYCTLHPNMKMTVVVR